MIFFSNDESERATRRKQMQIRSPQAPKSGPLCYGIRRLVLWPAIFGVLLLCHGADGQPQIVRWTVQATVTEVDDPLGLFPDVRLGDPVGGTLKYDANVLLDPGYLSSFYFDPSFEVCSMSIQNPRNGTEMRFQTDPNGDFADVNVFNGYADENGPFDGIFTPQSVLAPAGFAGSAPVVDIILQGPPTVFAPSDDSPPAQTDLPTTLDLNDWPIAAIEFQDGWFSDPTNTYIQAEILSLTPIMTSYAAGDYNYDGKVDSADYHAWRNKFGSEDVLYADGNRDGVVGAADYAIWRKNLGQSSGSSSSAAVSNGVPEPETALLFVTGLLAVYLQRRAAAS
jgi:hypothetical protein